MKKQLLFLPLLLVASIFMAFYVMDVQAQDTSPSQETSAEPSEEPIKAKPRTLAAPACSGFYGTFKATNWPGGKLELTCPGKSRPRGKCVGASAQLSPGEPFSFNNCNCLDPKSKCLTVAKLPPGCTMKSKLACASNRETVDGTFQVECAEPVPCEVTPSDVLPSDALPSDALPSDVLPSDLSPTDISISQTLPDAASPQVGGPSSAATAMGPSFFCLGLGSDGECLSPTPEVPCVSPSPSDILPSDAIPSDIVPSDDIPSGETP